MKKLVLNYEQQQEEEEYQGKGGAVSCLKFDLVTMMCVFSNSNGG